jgi:hypothetical protein
VRWCGGVYKKKKLMYSSPRFDEASNTLDYVFFSGFPSLPAGLFQVAETKPQDGQNARKIARTIQVRNDGFGFHRSPEVRHLQLSTSGVTMLRSIRSTAFLGTLLLAGAASAQTKPAKSAATDDTLIENGKPGAAPAANEGAGAPVAVPAPPPPADDEAAVEETPSAPKRRTISGAGLSTQSTTKGGGEEVGDSSSDKDWGFKFKGFFRAPMRIGIDTSGRLGKSTDSSGGGSLTANTLQFHAPPVVPDGNYTRWMYTNINPGPWAELLFQYGNQRVMMTTSIASYNITSGGWRELQDQLGIDRAFLTLKFPEALGNLGGMAWDVGIFSNSYGAAGKYDAGQYETYIIGRTRLAGATATADMDVSDDVKLIFEGGGGAKVDQQYQQYASDPAAPSYSRNLCTADTGTSKACFDYPSWQPFPGNKTQQGTNMLGHLHAGAVINGVLTVQAHYIGSFVKDKRWNVATTGGTSAYPGADFVPGYGYIQVAGIDFKLNGGWMGDGYIGYSYIKAKNALTINDSIEVLHSQGGWQFAQNYFPTAYLRGYGGDGEVHTIAGQYTFSLAAFMMRPRPFWGQTADITIRPFFMFNKVTGATDGVDNMTKFKGGFDVLYSFIPMMSAGLRFDAVNPNMSNSDQTFYVFSPRLVFRSEFVTHEAIVLQYSYYGYGSAYTDPSRSAGTSLTDPGVMPWPYGKYGTWSIGNSKDTPGLNTVPDKHVVSLWAQMWW